MTLPRGGLVLSFGENCLLTLFFSVVHFCLSLCFILSFILVFPASLRSGNVQSTDFHL